MIINTERKAIIVTWTVSASEGRHEFSLDDLNVGSTNEWISMSREQQRERLQEALNKLPEQPVMVLN